MREVGDVQVVRRDCLTHKQTADAIDRHAPDAIVYFQTMPSSSQHFWRFRQIPQVWVPMYDDFPTLALRYRLMMWYCGVHVVAFSQKVHEYFSQHRIRSMRCLYFPQPRQQVALAPAKPPYTVFLWQRVPEIGLEMISKLFAPGQVRKVIYKTNDSSWTVPSVPFEVEHITGWLSKDELLRHVSQADYYIAPRPREGIGHGYLEAMAMGKVVVGYDDATMNEYIQEGVNGHLFHTDGPSSTSWANPQQLLPNIIKYGQAARATWLRDRERIKELFVNL
jgi:glycosyltransferase involved in cell wall biosynthesis